MRPAADVGRVARDAAVGAVHGAMTLWRRSLRTRVVAGTLVLSLVVVAILGTTLLNRVAAGLLDAKRDSALVEATSGFAEAQRIVESAPTPTDAVTRSALIDDVAVSLLARAGSPGLYEVLLMAAGSPEGSDIPERGSNLVGEQSVPDDLRAAIAEEQRQAWTYSTLRYTDGATAPGLVVGAPVHAPGVGAYEVYYLFPLVQEQQTLSLVTKLMTAAGVALVVLLGAIAWLVTRQVVIPVRMAARIAEGFAAGRLDERMKVRGEDDLARLATAFNSMATSLKRQIRQLEDLSRVQRRFVSDVSHELRTPLTTVRMAADMIHERRDELDPAAARAAELLVEQLDRFEELLSDLLEISRFDAGAAVLDAEPVDLRLLVDRVVDTVRPLADAKQTPVEVAAPADPCEARVDPRRIERVVRNLVVNAVEHGAGRPVRITVAADDLAVAVAVRDHGVGLRPGEAALVFNRFWRGDPARARTTGGTGLGLAISLEDARLHGGWLEAWGVPGGGSQFRLTLPRDVGEDVVSSPLPLRPDDADDRRRVPLSVGAPYRSVEPRPDDEEVPADVAAAKERDRVARSKGGAQ